MTDGWCWQTIKKKISIVESRGYESMYQLLGGTLRDVFSDVTDSFHMLETWTPDIIDVFFKVHVLIKHYSQISRTCAWRNVVISDVNVCGSNSLTKIWWGNKQKFSFFPSFSCNLLINIHILISAMQDWTSFMAISPLMLSDVLKVM